MCTGYGNLSRLRCCSIVTRIKNWRWERPGNWASSRLITPLKPSHTQAILCRLHTHTYLVHHSSTWQCLQSCKNGGSEDSTQLKIFPLHRVCWCVSSAAGPCMTPPLVSSPRLCPGGRRVWRRRQGYQSH